MKSLEKATADYEKTKEKMEASKARYEADLKRFKAAEIAKTEAISMDLDDGKKKGRLHQPSGKEKR